MNLQVCVVARDNSKLCNGVSPTATQDGWFGEKQCMFIEVTQVQFEWTGEWIQALMQRPTPHPVYVGCTLSFNVSVNETTSGAAYGLQVGRAESKDELAIEAKKMDVSLTRDLGFSAVAATPLLGSEGSTLTMCFSGGDKYEGLTLKGMCTEDHLKACSADVDCAVGICSPVCVKVEVQKCRYCVQDGDPLKAMRRSYLADTNWLKLWALNDETHSKLGTECLPGLDCDQDVVNSIAIDNPHLILNTPSSVGKRILWAGITIISFVLVLKHVTLLLLQSSPCTPHLFDVSFSCYDYLLTHTQSHFHISRSQDYSTHHRAHNLSRILPAFSAQT